MNDVEKLYIENWFHERSEGKTMEDYFNEVPWDSNSDIDKIKKSMKDANPDET